MLDMGFAEDLEAILRPAGGAPDGAVLGHAAAAHRGDREAAPEATRCASHRAREDADGREPPRAPGGLRRARATSWPRWGACSTWRTPPRPRVLPHAHRGRRADRGPGGRGYRAEALHGGLSQEQRDRVMRRFRDGACSSWWPPTWRRAGWTSSTCPTSSTTMCRRQPRRTCTASGAPAAPAARAWRSRSPSRESSASCATSRGRPAADRRREGADGGGVRARQRELRARRSAACWSLESAPRGDRGVAPPSSTSRTSRRRR